MDDSGEGRRFNALAAPQHHHKVSPDGPGISTAIMLQLGAQLRAYYDRLPSLPIAHHVTDAADPDTRSRRPTKGSSSP
jgi:hypothetical protein